LKIGFIGQGWIGKNYADDFEARGFEVVRYALEPEYLGNLPAIAECSIVLVAVPTPTTRAGFDLSAVRSALASVKGDSTVVIKSTMLPGSTELLQSEFPWLYVFHSPEFLTEATAAYDAAHPRRNIIGTPRPQDLEFAIRAHEIQSVLPFAPFNSVIPAAAAELIKYAGNCFLYTKVIFTNILFDLAASLGVEWSQIADALGADPRIGSTHLEPNHASGRGAGGHCFIKDFAAFRRFYFDHVPDDCDGQDVLEAIECKNVGLLTDSNKDLELLKAVYSTKTKK
jgi:nucleotide sugar dehydrogenase